MRHARSPRVRIIGGKWKGRKLRVHAGVRPTPDRAKVTLFNWLGPALAGARVLDLFAGTGALGFEALSRGAACATFVERHRGVARALAAARAALGATAAAIECGSALPWLARQPPDARWDVVFLDPPFQRDLATAAACAVAPRLAAGGVVYLEVGGQNGLPELARRAGLVVRRESAIGAVRVGLLEAEPPATGAVSA